VLQNYEGIYFHTDNAFALGSYSEIQFYIYSSVYLSASYITVLLYTSAAEAGVCEEREEMDT
jgi:hypothetical protein